ncbi:MAG: hypothetical protein K6E56_00455 [Lachnospiraceae bacterium]|nr:hypothetical protein [Lachnospiraceae bacterium]
MKLGEIPVGDIVQIRASRGENKFECEALVVDGHDDRIFISLIKHDGQTVDFSNEQIQILAFYVKNAKVYGWSAVRIKKDTYKNKLCHTLICKKDSVFVNRRTDKRIKTSVYGNLRLQSESKDLSCLIVNYSKDGFAFDIAMKINEKHDYYPASIIFEDTTKEFYVNLRCRILRCMNMGNGMYRYGACIVQESDAWANYVEEKREEIRQRAQEAKNETVNIMF